MALAVVMMLPPSQRPRALISAVPLVDTALDLLHDPAARRKKALFQEIQELYRTLPWTFSIRICSTSEMDEMSRENI